MIRDVHHVGIAVRDLDAALALYRDALQLPCVKQGDVPSRGVRAAMLAAGRSYLEIIAPTRDDSPFAAFLLDKGEGLHHVALWSGDVESDVASLRDQNVPLIDNHARDGFTGRLSYLDPAAFDGAQMEVVQPEPALTGDNPIPGHLPAGRQGITRIDHVVFRVPHSLGFCGRMRDWFGVETKRTFERGDMTFAFMHPGDVIMEVIGPTEPPAEPRPGYIAGLAFEVQGIDDLTAGLKAQGYPIGEPHAALQGGCIVSLHHTGAFGVPLAFIDFTRSPGPVKDVR